MTTHTVTTQAALDAALATAAADPSGWHDIDIRSAAGVWLVLSSVPGSASVQATDSASVQATDSASVRATGSASVQATDSASVQASDSASVQAYGSASVRASDSASVRASGSASVQAYGSASVQAYDSASVQATGSASVRASGSASVQAYGSASVRASGSASVQAYGSASVQASSFVSVHLHSSRATVTGGILIDVSALDQTDVATWIDYTGAETDGDHVVLYKAVNDDYTSPHGFAYPLGATVEPPDWTDTNDCGGGLHLSPHAHQAGYYHDAATRFLRCLVHRDDLRPIPGDVAKCKARRVQVVEEVSA